jgi:DNA-binding HxlR family transcriptional regulator
VNQITEEEACKAAFVVAIKDALHVVSGKWKLAIVCTLLLGPRRFNEMERLLNGLTPRMLTRELRELEVNGVVARVQLEAPSGTVRGYELTASGRQLESVIIGMANWGVQHRAFSASNLQSHASQPVSQV